MKLQIDAGYDVQKQQTIVTAVLRLVFALTSLVETSEFFEVRLFFLDDFFLMIVCIANVTLSSILLALFSELPM